MEVLAVMYIPRFELAGFELLPAEVRCRIVLELVRGMIAVNRLEWRTCLNAGEPPPALYDAGIRYAEQGKTQDDWKDWLRVVQTGCGSCNSLAAWRVAELLENGADAGPFVRTDYQQDTHGKLFEIFHVILWRRSAQGLEWEDPSALLGMRVPPGVVSAPSLA